MGCFTYSIYIQICTYLISLVTASKSEFLENICYYFCSRDCENVLLSRTFLMTQYILIQASLLMMCKILMTWTGKWKPNRHNLKDLGARYVISREGLRYFLVIALREKCPNTELFLVRIQSEYRKIRTRNNSAFWHLSRSVVLKAFSKVALF